MRRLRPKTSTLQLGKQGPRRPGLPVSIDADEDQLAFSEAFDFEPRLRLAAAVGGISELGDNAFKLVLGAGFEECGTVARELLAECSTLCVGFDQFPELENQWRSCLLSADRKASKSEAPRAS